jgi:hypothetical protein
MKDITSDALSSSPASESEGAGSEYTVSFNMAFSLSMFASFKALSNSDFASGLSSLMNFKGDGQTRGSADEGFSKAAHARCLCLRETAYGNLLQRSFHLQVSTTPSKTHN